MARNDAVAGLEDEIAFLADSLTLLLREHGRLRREFAAVLRKVGPVRLHREDQHLPPGVGEIERVEDAATGVTEFRYRAR